MMTLFKRIRLLLAAMVLLPAMVQAQFACTTNDGVITITGYTGSNSVVVIPDTLNGHPVTGIGDNAFAYDNNLTNITIPTSITSIGIAAFYGCINLAGVTIPDSVTNIGAAAFNSCLSLSNVTIPANVTSIGDYAFFYCTNLTAISVNATNSFFSSANGVLFNQDKTILMQFPFGKGGSYSIPNSVTSIADEAFGINDHGQYPFPSACPSLTNLIIPGSVTNLGDYAFAHCDGLLSLTLASGLANIGNYAFFDCTSLTSLGIPGSVAGIGYNTFEHCISLAKVTLGDGVTSIQGADFADCWMLTNITIPDSVTNIGQYAFYACPMTSISIPSNVTDIGNHAFYNCGNLTRIYFYGDAPDNIGLQVFDGDFGFDPATVYYLPGKVNWDSTFGDIATAIWLPQMQTSGVDLGTKTNPSGFNIDWASGQTVVVEASTNLVDWQPVQTNVLTTGIAYFSDPQWANYPGRFYRLRSP